MSRPKNFAVGAVRVRVIRGPKKDGTWYWRAERHEGGDSATVWTGWGTRTQVEQAIAARVAAGTVDQPVARAADRVETVRDLLEVWVAAQEAREDLSPRTLAISRLSARHLLTHVGAVRLDRLDLPPLERFRDTRLRQGAATRTVELDLEILRRAWNWGREAGLCRDRRLPKAKIALKPKRSRYTPTREEVWATIEQLEGWPRLCLWLLFATGGRIGEIASLTWDAIDLTHGALELVGKTGPREVAVPDVILDELRKNPTKRKGSRIFPVGAYTIQQSMSQRYIPMACEKAGVPRFTPHAIRRLVIDLYYEANVDVGTVAAQMGQSPPVALKYYRQARPENKRRAVLTAGIGLPSESNVIPIDKAKKGS